MDEARRFLRYATPGIVFATESAFLIWLLIPRWVTAHLPAQESIGVWIGALLASGGLGFIFSAIHHQTHWWFGRPATDYRPSLNALINNKVIDVKTPDGTTLSRLTDRAQAWLLASILWDERRSSALIKDSDAELKVLNDLFHSMGAARVAAVASPALVALFVAERAQFYGLHTTDGKSVLAAAIALMWFVVVWGNTHRLGIFARLTLEQTLTDALYREKGSARDPILIHLTFSEPGGWWHNLRYRFSNLHKWRRQP